jgi:DNA replication initiation complex subunit (GINS family)
MSDPYHRSVRNAREHHRLERQQEKAERKAQRRAEKLNGQPIAALPENYQGLARTLAPEPRIAR